MGFGGSLGKFATPVLAGTSMFGDKAKDLLLGKKSEGVEGGFSKLNSIQKQSLGLFKDQLNATGNLRPDEMVKADLGQQERLIRAGAADQGRQAQSLVNQRGLGRSSVGLNALLSSDRGLNDRIFASRSSAPLLRQQYENEKINRLNSISGGIGNILNSRMYTMPQAGGVRTGGLLKPLLAIGGAAAGGSMGGPQGAAAGYQAGSGLGSALQNY